MMTLNFLFDSGDKRVGNQPRLKRSPYTGAQWDNHIAAHVSQRIGGVVVVDNNNLNLVRHC